MRNYGMRRRFEERVFNPETADPPFHDWPPIIEQDRRPDSMLDIVAAFSIATVVIGFLILWLL